MSTPDHHSSSSSSLSTLFSNLSTTTSGSSLVSLASGGEGVTSTGNKLPSVDEASDSATGDDQVLYLWLLRTRRTLQPPYLLSAKPSLVRLPSAPQASSQDSTSSPLDVRTVPHIVETIIQNALRDPAAHPILRQVNRGMLERVSTVSMTHIRIKADWEHAVTIQAHGVNMLFASLVLAYPHSDRAIPGLSYDLSDIPGITRTRARLLRHTKVVDEPLDVKSIHHLHLAGVYHYVRKIETFRTCSSVATFDIPVAPLLSTFYTFKETCLTPWENATPVWCDFVPPGPTIATFTIMYGPDSPALPNTFLRLPSHDTREHLKELVIVFLPVTPALHAMTLTEMGSAEAHAERARDSPDSQRMLVPLAALVLDKPDTLKVTLVGMENVPAVCLGDWCTQVHSARCEGWFTACVPQLQASNLPQLLGDVHDLDEIVREVTLEEYRREVGEDAFRMATEAHVDMVRGSPL
ncbi:uncharacterized protein LOC62_07G008916 [Vanrija pseudolonga]|uniref:Uncharacterized protein n=1 Tax=Vanrija pseudolonga TaxID=143232 RepID=A0AAF0YFJ2_9TREE|nr:hypothetical protein LOC62_07G008916 [Vanrija pseudolonga]